MALYSQTVSNVTVEQVDKTIHVSYDLDQQADISLFISTDGGSHYTELHQLTGDIGTDIPAGHRTIVWNVLAEREQLVGNDIVFKVSAQGKSDLAFTVKDITFMMVYVEGGTFTMGCTSKQGGDCYGDEKPSHLVTLSDYWIGETEVTQALWKVVMNTTVREQRNRVNPEGMMCGEGANYPMYYVSWNEAMEFCNELNRKLSDQLPSGYRFALPTEAQWNYAAKGGNKSRGYMYAGSNIIEKVAWHIDNSSSATHPVKSKTANELELYDMSGNVWEWCSDWYRYYSNSSQTNPTGPSSGSDRVLRGGSWYDHAVNCRVAYRYFYAPDHCESYIGFRLSLVHE